jgi:hypothetical protein
LRVEYEGAIHRVKVRSNGGIALFKNDGDRRYLLNRFGEATATYQVRVYQFCLMSNHFQRSVAGVLGVRTASAVNCQLKKLATLLDTDEGLRAKLLRIERRLDSEQKRQAC